MRDGAGVWRGMAHAAEPIRDIRVADGGSPLFLHYDHAEVGGSPLGYIVENRVIRRALFEHLAGQAGVALFAPSNIASVERGPAAATVTLGDGRVLRAGLVVAADGKGRSEGHTSALQSLMRISDAGFFLQKK